MPPLLKKFAQARVKFLGCLPRDHVVAAYRALLLGYVMRRVQADNAIKTRARKPLLGGFDLLLEGSVGGFLVVNAGQDLTPP